MLPFDPRRMSYTPEGAIAIRPNADELERMALKKKNRELEETLNKIKEALPQLKEVL